VGRFLIIILFTLLLILSINHFADFQLKNDTSTKSQTLLLPQLTLTSTPTSTPKAIPSVIPTPLSTMTPSPKSQTNSYWFLLMRKSNKEYLYSGSPGDKSKSVLIKTFTVKTGIPGQRPTPLPSLVGRKYWIITDKKDSSNNPETSPYFLTLNIPFNTESFGPEPYLECGGQCNWILPGSFGLHGVNGDNNRLSADDPGSSGCIRHSNEDITYLYKLLDPKHQEIRYYIVDI
jgi:hypothetical protein